MRGDPGCGVAVPGLAVRRPRGWGGGREPSVPVVAGREGPVPPEPRLGGGRAWPRDLRFPCPGNEGLGEAGWDRGSCPRAG